MMPFCDELAINAKSRYYSIGKERGKGLLTGS
jgi:hypothetical protein